MAVPVDENLISILYEKYNITQPDQAGIDAINEKYGDNNEAFAKDFFIEHGGDKAKNTEWLNEKLTYVNEMYPSNGEEEELKKKRRPKLGNWILHPKKSLLRLISTFKRKFLFRIFPFYQKVKR